MFIYICFSIRRPIRSVQDFDCNLEALIGHWGPNTSFGATQIGEPPKSNHPIQDQISTALSFPVLMSGMSWTWIHTSAWHCVRSCTIQQRRKSSQRSLLVILPWSLRFWNSQAFKQCFQKWLDMRSSKRWCQHDVRMHLLRWQIVSIPKNA